MKDSFGVSVHDLPSFGIFGEFVVPEIEGSITLEGPEDAWVFIFNGNRKLVLSRKHCKVSDENVGLAGGKHGKFGIIIREDIRKLTDLGVGAASEEKTPKAFPLFRRFGKSSGVYFSL